LNFECNKLPLRNRTYENVTIHTTGAQKVIQHIYFLGPFLLNKNNILRPVAFKCPAFMHVVARFPARWYRSSELFKMESVKTARSKQKAVTEFLLAESESITNIHRRLTNV
jgi:hypothetical protein